MVDSRGYDGRSWLDHFGYPHSENMRLQERSRRVASNKMELVITITDPVVYTTPWVSQTHEFVLVPRAELTLNGWYGFLEGICAPIDAQEFKPKGQRRRARSLLLWFADHRGRPSHGLQPVEGTDNART